MNDAPTRGYGRDVGNRIQPAGHRAFQHSADPPQPHDSTSARAPCLPLGPQQLHASATARARSTNLQREPGAAPAEGLHDHAPQDAAVHELFAAETGKDRYGVEGKRRHAGGLGA